MSKQSVENVFRNLGASNHCKDDRQSEDFYSTQQSTVKALVNKLKEYNIDLTNKVIIEPAVGQGDILKAIFDTTPNNVYFKYKAYDIVDRGYPNTQVVDFLTVKDLGINGDKCIITNPPYNNALEFVEHSIDLLNNGEYNIDLLKIQFLEGKKRKEFFKKNPPKYVFVFTERQKCLKDGVDNGSTSAVCYCWYVWQKGFKGKPTLDWI